MSSIRKPANDRGAIAFQSDPGTPINPPVRTISEPTARGMAERIFQSQGSALRKSDDDQTIRRQPPVLAGFQDRFVAPLHRLAKVGLVRLSWIEKSSGIPAAGSLRFRHHPADPFDSAEPGG